MPATFCGAVRFATTAEIGEGKAVEGEEGQSQEDDDADGEKVVDDGEGQGVRLGNIEEA